jgi:hypothetical protein
VVPSATRYGCWSAAAVANVVEPEHGDVVGRGAESDVDLGARDDGVDVAGGGARRGGVDRRQLDAGGAVEPRSSGLVPGGRVLPPPVDPAGVGRCTVPPEDELVTSLDEERVAFEDRRIDRHVGLA